MSEIEKAFGLINSFATKAAEVAPVVWAKMIMLIQAESIAYLAVGGVCLLFSIVLSFVCLKMKVNNYGEWTPQKVVSGICALVALIPAGINLLYPWNWIGAFAPEARLIARILGTLTGTSN